MAVVRSKLGQRLQGIFLLASSLAYLIWEWRTLSATGVYHPKVAALVPLGAIAGLGLLLFPIDYAALKAEHGVEKTEFFRHLPAAWKWLSLAALVASLLNWYLMAHQ